MIQPLRVWHRWIFLALVFLVPIVFIAGLAARHHPVPQKSASP